MGLTRVELVTPSLSEKCSNQLSYKPITLQTAILVKQDCGYSLKIGKERKEGGGTTFS